MPIGGPDKAAREEQLAAYARVQVRAGLNGRDQIEREVGEAVLDEIADPGQAARRTRDLVDQAYADLATDATVWPEVTDYDRLQVAIAALEAAQVIVLQGCEDHWSASERLTEEAKHNGEPWGIAYFTPPDVWHAVEHDMLELNVWHGNSANVAPGDELLDFVHDTLAAHGLASVFDEGRIEVTMQWQRRPAEV